LLPEILFFFFFSDEFDILNTSLWHHEINMNGGYNDELQIYDVYPENSYVSDGILYIRPTMSLDTVFGGDLEQLYNGSLILEGCTDPMGGERCGRNASYPWINPPIVSARIRTQGSFSFRYGRIEIRAKMPSADWTWPAMWMMPEDSVYGDWPKSGEIDIMEGRGNRKLFSEWDQNLGSEMTASTLMFGNAFEYTPFWTARGERNTRPDQGYDRDFHLWELEWTPDKMHFKIDGKDLVNVVPPEGGFYELGLFPEGTPNPWINATDNPRMAPYDQNFHFILNVASGGRYFFSKSNPSPPFYGEHPFLDFLNAQEEWINTWDGESQAMAIDYIRVYAV